MLFDLVLWWDLVAPNTHPLPRPGVDLDPGSSIECMGAEDRGGGSEDAGRAWNTWPPSWKVQALGMRPNGQEGWSTWSAKSVT